MNTEERIELLKEFVHDFGRAFAPSVEIVLYDLRKDGEIAAIENGHVTNRKKGDMMTQEAIRMTDEAIEEHNGSVGVLRRNENGKSIRASHFFFKDEEGRPYARICINQDVSQLEEMRKTLRTLINISNLPEDDSNSNLNAVRNACRSIIIREVQKYMPIEYQSREKKVSIIGELYRKGVFDVKDSVIEVCDILNISQSTLYNILREIRTLKNDGR